MPTTARQRRNDLAGEGKSNEPFALTGLFPEREDGKPRGPLAAQLPVFTWTLDGSIEDGGVVFAGGLGAGKTLVGASWIIWCHHQKEWLGFRSIIARESYPALAMSTADEFFQAVERLPKGIVKDATRPSRNTLGYVEWEVGGLTLLVSSSDTDTWASANLGAAWIDEGHRHDARVIHSIMERTRHPRAPRAVLVTTNAGGKNHIWRIAHPDSKEKLPSWRWIQASSLENPCLPVGYRARLVSMYPEGSAAHRRWVLGESSALEGLAYPEFDPSPTSGLYVVPDHRLPEEWPCGRGFDWGAKHPAACVWGAWDGRAWWVYRVFRESGLSVSDVAGAVIEGDQESPGPVNMFPADPSIFAETRVAEGTRIPYSLADEFREHGVYFTRGNNDRMASLALVRELLKVDPASPHPLTLSPGAPRLYILNRPDTDALVEELSSLQWVEDTKAVVNPRREDVQKKQDDAFDGMRYLVMEKPPSGPPPPRELRPARPRGTRSYRGY